MPLDNTTYRTTPKVLAKGFDGLRQISTMLRGVLPSGFTWDFEVDIRRDKCGSVGCALGWVHIVWNDEVNHPDVDSLLSHLGLGEKNEYGVYYDSLSLNLQALFGFHGQLPYPVDGSEVTPLMVAAKLDEFIYEYDA